MVGVNLLRALALTQALAAPPSVDVPSSAPVVPQAQLHAQKAYARQELGIEEFSGVTDDGGTYSYAVPTLGKYHEPLASDDFYRRVGREDLAAQYDAANRVRVGVIASSVVVTLGSLAVGMVYAFQSAPSCNPAASNFMGCLDAQSDFEATHVRDGVLLSVGGSLVGTGLMLAGLLDDPEPVSLAQRRELADEHNQKLRQELGLPVDPSARADAPASGPELAVAPLLSPTGGGVALSGIF